MDAAWAPVFLAHEALREALHRERIRREAA
jgi:hypothetical protein